MSGDSPARRRREFAPPPGVHIVAALSETRRPISKARALHLFTDAEVDAAIASAAGERDDEEDA